MTRCALLRERLRSNLGHRQIFSPWQTRIASCDVTTNLTAQWRSYWESCRQNVPQPTGSFALSDLSKAKDNSVRCARLLVPLRRRRTPLVRLEIYIISSLHFGIMILILSRRFPLTPRRQHLFSTAYDIRKAGTKVWPRACVATIKAPRPLLHQLVAKLKKLYWPTRLTAAF